MDGTLDGIRTYHATTEASTPYPRSDCLFYQIPQAVGLIDPDETQVCEHGWLHVWAFGNMQVGGLHHFP